MLIKHWRRFSLLLRREKRSSSNRLSAWRWERFSRFWLFFDEKGFLVSQKKTRKVWIFSLLLLFFVCLPLTYQACVIPLWLQGCWGLSQLLSGWTRTFWKGGKWEQKEWMSWQIRSMFQISMVLHFYISFYNWGGGSLCRSNPEMTSRFLQL